MALSSAGQLHVANSSSDRVVQVDRPSGRVVRVYTTARPALAKPKGVAVDGSGAVFIVDTRNNRVIKMDSGGALVSTLNVSVILPFGPALDARGLLYIADSGNARVLQADVTSNPNAVHYLQHHQS